MRLIRAARGAGVAALAAGIYSLVILRQVYHPTAIAQYTQGLPEETPWQWGFGGWLWLLAIFSWMVLLVALMHYYSPVHRISSSLQSGLMVIAATLLIAGILAGMNRFGLVHALNADQPVGPITATEKIVELFALSLLEAGLLMGGGVTTWICIDLVVLKKLPAAWMVPGAAAGVLALFSPFLLPELRHLLIALFAYCVWCLILGFRTSLPAGYPDFE